jgi:hypothetical protein
MMTAPQTQQAETDSQVNSPDPLIDTAIPKVSGVCSFTRVSKHHSQLLENLSQALPDLAFAVALTRGGWHRVGGLMDNEGGRISDHLIEWIEQNSNSDITNFYANYAEAGYIVTHIHGKTHYLVARTGNAPQDFIQLEIEELQELSDHLLFGEDEIPDDIDDLIEPGKVTPVEQEAVGEPRYVFRRMTSIADYLQRLSDKKNGAGAIRRFIEDWARSSAGECGTFSDHWVLGLREYTDAYGEPVVLAQPVSTHTADIPRLEKEHVSHGSTLANMIHGFDRHMGYPMAWYFYMLTHSNVPYQLVEAIHHDQMGAYDYLPAKDLKVLIDWYNKPYSV